MAADSRLRHAGPPIATVVLLSPLAILLFQCGVPIEFLVFGLLLGGYKGSRLFEKCTRNHKSTEDAQVRRQYANQEHSDSPAEGAPKATLSSSSSAWRPSLGNWRSRGKTTEDHSDDKRKDKEDFLIWRRGGGDKGRKKSPVEEKKETSRSALSAIKKNMGQTQWRSLINKFTPEKFDKLCEQLLATLPAENKASGEPVSLDEYRHCLDDLLALIFDASSRQHNYTEMYTELCKKILEFVAKQRPDLDGEGRIWEKCQSIFLNTVLKTPEFPADLAEDELMDRKAKHKEKMVGMVKFGGDLVAHGLVPGDGVMQWIHTLLSEKCQEFDADDSQFVSPDGDAEGQGQDKDVEQREVQLEVLCAILASMGPSLSDSDTWSEENRSVIEDVFLQLDSLASDPHLSLRIRCLIRDILDLRMAQWKEKAFKLKPSVLEKRRKDGEEDGDSSLREDAPEFTPGCQWKPGIDMGKAPDAQLLAPLQAVEHHLEVIEDKEAKLQRLKAMVQLHVIIQEKQMAVVANSGSVKRCIEILTKSFEELDVRSFDFSMPEQVRKANLRAFETGAASVLIMTSEVSTRKEFELSKSIPVLVNFDFPMTIHLYLYRIVKRCTADPTNHAFNTHVYTFFMPANDVRHTDALIVTLEAAKHKVPPALHKLREQMRAEAQPPKREREPGKGRMPKSGEGRHEDDPPHRSRTDDKEDRDLRSWDHRGDHRGGDHRGGDYRGGDHRGGDHRGADHRGGDHRGGEHRSGDHRGGDHRGGEHHRGDHRGEEAGEGGKGSSSGKGKPRHRGDGQYRGDGGGQSQGQYRGEGRQQDEGRRGDADSKAGRRPVGGRGPRQTGGNHSERSVDDPPQRFEILQRGPEGQRNERAPWFENTGNHREAGRGADHDGASDERPLKATSSPALGPADRPRPHRPLVQRTGPGR